MRRIETISDPEAEDADESFLLAPAYIEAFSLVKKEAKFVEISKLQPVSFNENIFKKLVIDKKYKIMYGTMIFSNFIVQITHKTYRVTAMVRAYVNKDASFRDLVKGKGRGLIVLLHGSPGTGKTLTAGT